MSYESLEEAKKYHIHNHTFWAGESLAEYKYQIWDIIKRNKYTNVLDYGCGKAVFHKLLFNNNKTPGAPQGINITCYDPAYVPFSKKPEGQFEFIICTDVLEHVQEDKVEEVLADIFSYGNNVFLTITCYDATQILLNGKNAHYTVKEPDWWKQKLEPYNGKFMAIFQTKPHRGVEIVNKEEWEPNAETISKLERNARNLDPTQKERAKDIPGLDKLVKDN